MSHLHQSLAEIPEGDLYEAVMERFTLDYDARTEALGTEDALDRCTKLFENTSGSGDDDEAVPRVNMIRRAVEDYLSVAMGNIPQARLYAERLVPASMPEWQRELRLTLIREAEVVHNAYVKTILNREEANDKQERAVWQSGIYGAGYLKFDIDRGNRIAKLPQLRSILRKVSAGGSITESDLTSMDTMATRIAVTHIDSRDVYWEAGRRSVGECMRVSHVDFHSTLALRAMYEDDVEHPELIKAGQFPRKVGETRREKQVRDADSVTARLVMYETEEVVKEVEIESPSADPESAPETVTVEFTDVRMTKVTIVGGQVAEREVTYGVPDADSDQEIGPVRLPLVAFYLRESPNHCYGYPLPLALEVSEEFINSMRAIIYKMAKKAVAAQGVVVMTQNLGDGDLEEIEAVLEEGGVARVAPNQGVVDVRDLVMPLSYTAAPANPALLQAVDMETSTFNQQSQAVQQADLSSARTGAAARARLAASDRTKGMGVMAISRSVEECHESVYELVQTFHTEATTVAVEVPGGGRAAVTLNEPYSRTLIVQDDRARNEDNPFGFRLETFEDVLNPTAVQMYAQSDGRGNLPLDMVQRFQVLMALVEAQAILPETMRDLALDDDIKEMDDAARRRQAQAMQAQMAQQVAAQAAGGVGPMAGPPMGAQPVGPQPPAGPAPQQVAEMGGQSAGDVLQDPAEAAQF